MQKFDFRHAATNLEASRDTGAQLFCALLRSAGVEARLVCSLQPLPFTATVKTKTSQITTPKMAIANSDGRTALTSDESEIERKGKESREISNPIGSIGGRSRFSLGPPQRLGILNQSQKIDSPNRTNLSSKSSLVLARNLFHFNSDIHRTSTKTHQRISLSDILGRSF